MFSKALPGNIFQLLSHSLSISMCVKRLLPTNSFVRRHRLRCLSCIQAGTSDAVLSCFLASLKDRTMSCTPIPRHPQAMPYTAKFTSMYLTPISAVYQPCQL